MKSWAYGALAVLAAAVVGCANAGGNSCAQVECGANAVCADDTGEPVCSCADGFADDGAACVDIDECAEGTAACDDIATCVNTPGGYDCDCQEGFTFDGAACVDVDECAEGTATCAAPATCDNIEGGYECPCALGYLDELGDGSSCLPRAVGRVVLFGHDFQAIDTTATELLGNAVFAANTTGEVRVLGYVEDADPSPSGGVVNTDAAIESYAQVVGRTVSFAKFNQSSQLAGLIDDFDVLLIYDQVQAVGLELTLVGQSWQTPLDSFIRDGGVVIALDGGDTWRLLSAAGVMSVTSSSSVTTGQTLVQTEPANLVTLGVPPSYAAPNATTSFQINNAVKLIEDLSADFVVAQTGNFRSCVVVEDFESGVWPSGTWTAPEFVGGEASRDAAHDFDFGLVDPDFFYETDVLVGRPGQRVTAWVRFVGNGRAHLGVGSTSQSTHSFVLAADTNRVIMQRNQFYLFEDQTSASYDVELDTWYLLEVEFTTSSRLTGRVYREDPNNPGQPLINPDRVLAFDFGSLPPGGIAIRGSGGAQIDTVTACAP